MTKLTSDLDDKTLTDEWINSAEGGHPVLCIPYPEGMMVVIGTQQALKELTPKQQIEHGMALIEAGLRRL